MALVPSPTWTIWPAKLGPLGHQDNELVEERGKQRLEAEGLSQERLRYTGFSHSDANQSIDVMIVPHNANTNCLIAASLEIGF
jgi:hypothetical protein